MQIEANEHNVGPPPPPSEVRVLWLRCVSCGYSLESLPLDGVCPECATPVRWSAEGRRLAGWDPKRLREIVFACPWAWSVPVAYAWWIVIWALSAQITMTSTAATDLSGCISIVASVSVALGAVFSALAWLTVLQPAARPAFDCRRCRFAVVIAAVIMVLSALVFPPLRAKSGLGGTVVAAIGVTASAAHVAAGLVGLSRLALAMARPVLARWTVATAWCCIGPAMIAGLDALTMVLTPVGRGADQVVWTSAMIGSATGTLASLVLLITGAILLARVRRAAMDALDEPWIRGWRDVARELLMTFLPAVPLAMALGGGLLLASGVHWHQACKAMPGGTSRHDAGGQLSCSGLSG